METLEVLCILVGDVFRVIMSGRFVRTRRRRRHPPPRSPDPGQGTQGGAQAAGQVGVYVGEDVSVDVGVGVGVGLCGVDVGWVGVIVGVGADEGFCCSL